MDLIIVGALVLGLTEVIKRATGLKSKYIPLTALLISILLTVAYVLVNKTGTGWELVQNTLIVALTSVGLFSGVKNTVK